jgi:hypothetical protein
VFEGMDDLVVLIIQLLDHDETEISPHYEIIEIIEL